MRYKLLGKSGLRVSEISLGTMTFGEDWGWGADRAESGRIFDAYAERGGNFVDTACNYTNGTSEKYVGELVAADRARFVVATKYSLSTRADDPNASGNSRKNMVQSVERSLRRMNLDYVDLLWVHAWDFLTPVEEVMRGLDDLVRAGKVLYLGISDTPAWVVSRATTMAEVRGWTPFRAIQVRYNLLRREVERDLLPMARDLGMAVAAWGVLAGGVLTGKYTSGKPEEMDSLRRSRNDGLLTERNLAIAAALDRVAAGLGRPPAQVATAWARRKSPLVIPIAGARKASQLEDVLGCLDFELPDDALRALDEASKIDLGFPLEFLTSAGVRKLLYGDTYDLIDDHRS